MVGLNGRWMVVVLLMAACGDANAPSDAGDERGDGSGSVDDGTSADDGVDETATDATNGTSRGSSTSSSSASSTDDGTDGTDGTDGGATGVCLPSCDVAADCCGGDPRCWAVCEDGVCLPAECTADSCGNVTLFDGSSVPASCVPLDGRMTCVLACDADPSVCVQPNSLAACNGNADDGSHFCFEGCTSDFIGCPSTLACNEQTGKCECTEDLQCGDGQVCTAP